MQGLVNLLTNNLYGVQIRRDLEDYCTCKSEHWTQAEYDEDVLDYWRLPNGRYMVNLIKDDGLAGDKDVKNTLPSYSGAFILSNSKRIMNNLFREINGFFNNSIYYGDTDSLYVEKKYWDC